MKRIFKNMFVFVGIFVLFTCCVGAEGSDTSPVDITKLQFTTLEDSILVPETEIRVDPGISRAYIRGTVEGNGVRLRAEPSESATVLELMYDGEEVLIDGTLERGGWDKVQRVKTGRWGYVKTEYINPEGID